MTLQVRIFLHDLLRLLANLAQELGLLQRIHRDVGHAVLARTHQLPHPAKPHVLLRELETVTNSRQQLEPCNALLGWIVSQEQAAAAGRAATHAAAELM